MAAISRILQASLLGVCLLALAPPLGAQSQPVPPDPAPVDERAELVQAATSLEAELTTLLQELDVEITLQEENAGFGASSETLDRIDGLIARRALFAAKRNELRVLLNGLKEGQ